MLTMRIPLGLKNRIRDDIELEGDYSSMGAWMQAAAREYLEIREQKRNLRGGGSLIVKPSLKPFTM